MCMRPAKYTPLKMAAFNKYKMTMQVYRTIADLPLEFVLKSNGR